MERDKYQPPIENAENSSPIITYKDELYDPRRAFVHALDHFGLKFEYRPDTADSTIMHIHENGDTGIKVKSLMKRFEESSLFLLVQDVHQANPEPLIRYMRTQSITQSHPDVQEYRDAEFQHSIIEAFFVSAYERNTQRLGDLRTTYQARGSRTEEEIVEFTNRMRIAGVNGRDYTYSRERGITGISSNEIPDNLTPFIRQLTREDIKRDK
jgi:hypothetical protein